MKFSWKVFFCTIVMIALAFSVGGYLLVQVGFQNSLEREVSHGLEENLMSQFAFETAVVNIPTSDQGITDDMITQIGEKMGSGQRELRISDSTKKTLYDNLSVKLDNHILESVENSQRCYQIVEDKGRYYLQVACQFQTQDRNLYLESVRNISVLFSQRDEQFQTYQKLIIVILLASAVVMVGLSLWLTRPIRSLSVATRRIARGAYGKRVKVRGNDEIAEFTKNFNAMADVLEEKIHALEQVAQQKEEFIGNFAHELKTPLTAIIGYADMLRSQELEKDRAFRAANYIFQEGRRLESLSLKLLDLAITRQAKFDKKKVDTVQLAQDIAGVVTPMMEQCQIELVSDVERATIFVEPDLIKSLLINLLDNGRKASAPGKRVWLKGRKIEDGYLFEVKDEGRGIPKEELSKITEAFYMVDKSRARAQHGAGIGLALCEEIAKLHQTRLHFQSQEGVGTKVSFIVSIREKRQGGQ